MAKLKRKQVVVTKNYPMAVCAFVDEGVTGIIKECSRLVYLVEFEHCIYEGKDTGKKTWMVREDQLMEVTDV